MQRQHRQHAEHRAGRNPTGEVEGVPLGARRPTPVGVSGLRPHGARSAGWLDNAVAVVPLIDARVTRVYHSEAAEQILRAPPARPSSMTRLLSWRIRPANGSVTEPLARSDRIVPTKKGVGILSLRVSGPRWEGYSSSTAISTRRSVPRGPARLRFSIPSGGASNDPLTGPGNAGFGCSAAMASRRNAHRQLSRAKGRSSSWTPWVSTRSRASPGSAWPRETSPPIVSSQACTELVRRGVDGVRYLGLPGAAGCW